MNSTVFQEICFEEKNEKAVLRSIKKSKNRKGISLWQNKLTAVLSVSVIIALFLGIAYLPGDMSGLFNREKLIQEQHAAEDSLVIPEKQEESNKEMSKEEIFTMMINSIDHFETAKSQYIMYDKSVDGTAEIDFELSLKEKEGGYNKLTDNRKSGQFVTIWCYNDKFLWMINENKESYRVGEYVKKVDPKPIRIEEALQVNSEGIPVTNTRWRPPIGNAMKVLFPYDFASNYLRDLNQWEIEKQNEMLLGHNTLVIKGNMKHDTYKTFRFWVDKDTGILMKYENYDSHGEAGLYVHATEMEINVPVDSSKFTPNLENTGYKKEAFPQNPVDYDY